MAAMSACFAAEYCKSWTDSDDIAVALMVRVRGALGTNISTDWQLHLVLSDTCQIALCNCQIVRVI